eukprot:scaffold58986_cov64-Phaeocystis_antarctica.AAC.7
MITCNVFSQSSAWVQPWEPGPALGAAARLAAVRARLRLVRVPRRLEAGGRLEQQARRPRHVPLAGELGHKTLGLALGPVE